MMFQTSSAPKKNPTLPSIISTLVKSAVIWSAGRIFSRSFHMYGQGYNLPLGSWYLGCGCRVAMWEANLLDLNFVFWRWKIYNIVLDNIPIFLTIKITNIEFFFLLEVSSYSSKANETFFSGFSWSSKLDVLDTQCFSHELYCFKNSVVYCNRTSFFSRLKYHEEKICFPI